LERRYFDQRPRIEGSIAIAVVLIIIISGVLVFSVGRIGVGYVAVIVDPVFGTTSAVGDGANARYFFKPPWASVFKIYVATDSVNMWSEAVAKDDFPAVEALTKDGLRVDVDITVRWRVLPSGVVDVYRRFPGLDWKDRAIIPIIRETVRNLIVDYTAIETIESRGAIGTQLVQRLAEVFEAESSLQGAVLIDAVNLRRIALPDKFVKAIESKLAAEQLAIAAEFNKTKILVLANASAFSQRIRAAGMADSKLIIANATKKAIEVITIQLPETELTQITNLYLYLETLRDIAESGKGTFIIAPADSEQFIIPVPP
jgi:regulator of protease activity HflC (stomatin/prohibitin superfamily)